MEKFVGYLGPAGTYSHEVAIHVMGRDRQPLALDSSKFAQALQNKTVWQAILPLVNGTGGQVQWVLDLLANSSDEYSITRELVWNIRSHLIGFGTMEQVRTVCSHSQPLDQCQRFLAQMPGITTQGVGSTSAAVELVANKRDPTWAAIGTDCAVRLHKVPIIKRDISDCPDNQTLFVVLGGEKPPPTDNDKTSLLFGTPDRSGALLRVLEVFDALDINMSRILSLPSRSGRLGECLFFVDVDGNQYNEDLSAALRKIAKRAEGLRILGSYPKATCAANAD